MKRLLHFTADWCAPCKRMKPIIEEFVSENTDVEYIAIDVDKQLDLVEEYQIMSIPTLISVVDEKVVDTWTGIADKTKIQNLFK